MLNVFIYLFIEKAGDYDFDYLLVIEAISKLLDDSKPKVKGIIIFAGETHSERSFDYTCPFGGQDPRD